MIGKTKISCQDFQLTNITLASMQSLAPGKHNLTRLKSSKNKDNSQT